MGEKEQVGFCGFFQRLLPYYVKWSYIHHHDDGFSEFMRNGVTSGRLGVMGFLGSKQGFALLLMYQ